MKCAFPRTYLLENGVITSNLDQCRYFSKKALDSKLNKAMPKKKQKLSIREPKVILGYFKI